MRDSSYWKNPDLNFRPAELANSACVDIDAFVVDDFLDNPWAVRKELLDLEYIEPPNPYTEVISFNGVIPPRVENEIVEKSATVLQREVRLHPRSKCAMTYSKYPTHSVCHVDGGDGMCMFNWTLVIYMNPPEQCEGGTLLYRHRASGHVCNQDGWLHYAKDRKDPSKWECVETVEMRFNRALFCPAWRFHSISHTFGDTRENARLTLNPKLIAI